jgi:hypothetical protein
MCKHCDSDPCLWVEHSQCVFAAVELFKEELIAKGEKCPNNICRKYCYRQFTLMMHGPLGSGCRLKLPSCVEDNVRVAYPNETGIDYVGFKDN